MILGAGGQMGRASQSALQRIPFVFEVVPFGRELDICDFDAVAAMIRKVEPTIVLNVAAFTAVDACELNPERAFATNKLAVAALAAVCKELDVTLIHLSTDYVFGDDLDPPLNEGAPTVPLNVYGRSKVEGEAAIRAAGGRHVIIRTSWIYGPNSGNFFATLMQLGGERESLFVVEDESSCPTFADDLALCLVAVCERISTGSASFGTFHVAGSQGLSRLAFARAIMNERANLGLPYAQIEPTSQTGYGALARRPKDSRMDCTRFLNAYGMQPRALSDCLPQLVRAISS